MPFVEAVLGEDGKPKLVVCGQKPGPKLAAELAATGKSPGPDEYAVVIDYDILAAFVMEAVRHELAGEASLPKPL